VQCKIQRATFFRLGFASGEPLGAKTSMKKADGSAFGLAVQEPRSLRSRGCWCCIDPLYPVVSIGPYHISNSCFAELGTSLIYIFPGSSPVIYK
jgi:hypothetical protein